MNVPTGEFRALADKVEEYRKNQRALILTLAHLANTHPDYQPQDPGPERPRLRLIRGGRR